MPVTPGSVALTDGTTGPPAIKPASTAAIATDLALVVAVSPNNTIPTNITQISGAAITEGQQLMAASVPVVIASDQSSIPVSAPIITATPQTATWNSSTSINSTVILPIAGYATGQILLVKSGTILSGGFTLDVSKDGVNYINLSTSTNSPGLVSSRIFGNPIAANPVDMTSLTNAAAYLDIGAWTHLRVKLTTLITLTGNVSVFIGATTATMAPQIITTPTVSASQGNTAGSNLQSWWMRIGDTVNGPVAVKAASTIPVVADPALVIVPSPNTPLGGIGQQLMAASLPVVISSDQSAIQITGSVTASSSATATENNPSYTEGDTAAAFSQDLEGNLRTRIAALVSDARESYITGEIKSLSLTSDGRLRVSTSPSDTNLDFFGGFNPYGNADDFGISSDNPYQQSFPLG